MDSINWMDPPVAHLDKQSKRRVLGMIIAMGFWCLMMGGMLLGANIMKHSMVEKTNKMQARFEQQQQAMKILQEQKQSRCAASFLNTIFARPIRGVHLTLLSFSENWVIEGLIDYPRALDHLKEILDRDFESSTWTEQFKQSNSAFQVQGKMAC